MIEKSQILPYGLAIVATAVAVYQSSKEPQLLIRNEVQVVEKQVEVIKYKDRIRTITRVVTKPDGTKIEENVKEETRSGSETRTDEKKTDIVSETRKNDLTRYSVGVLCDIRECNAPRGYSLLAGFRIANLPLHLELGGGIKGVLVGVRVDF